MYRSNTKIPILIVSNDEGQVSQLVQMLYKSFPSEIANHQLFFSLVPSPELFTQLQLLSNWGRVFTLTSQLPDIPQANGNRLSNLEVICCFMTLGVIVEANNNTFCRIVKQLMRQVKQLPTVTCGENGFHFCPFDRCSPWQWHWTVL